MTNTSALEDSPLRESWLLLIVRASIHFAVWYLLLFWILTVVPIASDWYASNGMTYPPILDYVFRPAEFIVDHASGVLLATILLAMVNFGLITLLGLTGMGRFVRNAWETLLVVAPVLLLLVGSGLMLYVVLLSFDSVHYAFRVSKGETFERETELSGKWRLSEIERRGETSPSEAGDLQVTFESKGGRGGYLSRIQWRVESENAWGFMMSKLRSPSRILIMRMDGDHYQEQLHVLYHTDGDQLRMIFSPTGTPDAELPSNFDTRENDNVLLIFQRM